MKLVSTKVKKNIKSVYTDEKYEFLITGEPVICLTGEEFSKDINKEEQNNFVTNVLDYYINNNCCYVESEFGTITLDKKGIKQSKHHGISRIKAASYVAVPIVLAKGCVILPLDNYRSEDYYLERNNTASNIKNKTGILAAPIKIADKRYICIVMVMQHPQPESSTPAHINRLYVHESYIIEELQDFVASSPAIVRNTSNLLQNQRVITKILRSFFMNKNHKEESDAKVQNNSELNKSKSNQNSEININKPNKTENSNYNNMAKNSKKLYESIMNDVSKSVRRKMYENYVDDKEYLYDDIMESIGKIIKKRLNENTLADEIRSGFSFGAAIPPDDLGNGYSLNAEVDGFGSKDCDVLTDYMKKNINSALISAFEDKNEIPIAFIHSNHDTRHVRTNEYGISYIKARGCNVLCFPQKIEHALCKYLKDEGLIIRKKGRTKENATIYYVGVKR